MNRRDAVRLVALGVAGVFSRKFLPAQDAKLTAEPLADQLTVLMGDGGNMTLLKSRDGLLLVDSGYPQNSAAAAAKVKEVSPLPVKVLMNTHWHSDHTGGNVEFGKAGATIIAHDNTLKRLSTPQHMLFFNRDVEPLPAEGLPKTTFRANGKMTFGGASLSYRHLPPAHTDGDVTIHFENENVLSAGDLLFNGMYPFIDYSSGGSIEGMLSNSTLLLKMVDANTKIVPGHGPLATRADLAKFHDVLIDINNSMSALVKQGKTVDEVVAAAPTKKYDEQWGKGFLNPTAFVKMLYQGKTMVAAKAA